jgi:Wax ester synthase-like Acyl-CoA acyltransferase domain
MNPLDTIRSFPSEPEPMSAVDRAWLEMDTPQNPMVVTSILEFEDVADLEALRLALVDKTLLEPRFRQRVVVRDGGYFWLEDDVVHLGYHVQARELRGRAPDRQLRAAVAAESPGRWTARCRCGASRCSTWAAAARRCCSARTTPSPTAWR